MTPRFPEIRTMTFISRLNLAPVRAALTMSASLAFLAACTSEPTCDYSKAPYMAAQSVPPLRAPDGLTTPDHSGALVVPPAAPDAKPVPAGKGKCLDRPPSYFSTTPATPGTPEKK